MGLIRAAIQSVSSVMADQWEEFYYCDSMSADVLAVRGMKKTSKKGQNKKGSANIISNGSIIAVNEGQCMLIVDQGQVVEVSAEPGQFIFDTSAEPSVFYGDLGENITKSFDILGKRIAFGGETGRDQRVYYINTKEIIGNKYGTANPVPFRVVDNNIGLDMDIAIRCHGEYSYRIADPIRFYTNVCGNVDTVFARETLDSQLKSELMTAMQPAFGRISEMGIRYSALPMHTPEIAEVLNQVLSERWYELRGMVVASFGVNTVKASEEDENTIKQLQKTAVMRNPNMAAATLTEAQAEAMKLAAGNKATGPMMAFAGMNMAQNAGGINAQQLFGMGQQPQYRQETASSTSQQKAPAAAEDWKCACGAGNTGRFCTECGKSKPAEDGWTCTCKTINKGRFCMECGKPKPEGAVVYRCDKCGWEPEDKEHRPKFCPECGDIFDDGDSIK